MNREKRPPSREPGTRYTLSMPSMPPASGSDLPNSDSRLPDLLPGGAALAHLIAQAEASFRAARAGSTLRAYAHDWEAVSALGGAAPARSLAGFPRVRHLLCHGSHQERGPQVEHLAAPPGRHQPDAPADRVRAAHPRLGGEAVPVRAPAGTGRGADPQASGAHRRFEADPGGGPGHAAWQTGPGLAAAGVRGRVPALRTGGAQI